MQKIKLYAKKVFSFTLVLGYFMTDISGVILGLKTIDWTSLTSSHLQEHARYLTRVINEGTTTLQLFVITYCN